MVPKLKTLSLRTLLLDKQKLPLRPDDRFEHLLERFRVVFMASCMSKSTSILQRECLVFWLIEGQLHSLEITPSASEHAADLINWHGFDFPDGDILAWCDQMGIELNLINESDGDQHFKSPSGASITLSYGKLRNITLTI